MFKMADSNSDLKLLLEDFEQWQKITVDLYNENKDLKCQLSSLQKQCLLFDQSEKSLKQSNSELCLSVEKLQGTILKRCNIITENTRLKEKLTALSNETTLLEEQHKKQMIEATENLQAVQEAHKKDLLQIQSSITQQMRKEVESLRKSLQDKSDEISTLHRQLADTERDKHTEIVKLRLDYDAKLLKLQKQNTKSQVQTSSLTNNEIFRKKLQAAKIESEKELTFLRKRVSELERQTASSSNKSKLRKIG